MQDFRLDGKVALITGGARGLGAETAKVLASGGAKVVIADLLADEGEETAAEIGHANAQFARLDVTNEEQWIAVISGTVERFGGIDVVVNNAGIETTALFADSTFEDFNRTMAVNAGGVFLGTKHAIRAMRPGGISSRGGSIINISSAAGQKACFGLSSYCASKGAVRLMTKAAAIECGRLNYGIRVNSVHPGLVKTVMGAQVLDDYVDKGLIADEESAEAAFVGAHLLGLGRPRDIANGVYYLASDAARWVTGSELSVDGGFFAA